MPVNSKNGKRFDFNSIDWDKVEAEYVSPPPSNLRPGAVDDYDDEPQLPPFKLPAIVNASDFCGRNLPRPKEVIHNVLYREGKAVLSASSKSRKTWTAIDLAWSVATGGKWMGTFSTTKGRVLYLNFELLDHDFQQRLNTVAIAKGVMDKSSLDIIPGLRGQIMKATSLVIKLCERVKPGDYDLIILDPTYKMYGELEENSTGDMAEFTNWLGYLSKYTGAALIYTAHHPKGNMAERASRDRVAGSGAFLRDADAHIDFMKNQGGTEENPAYTVECTLRSFKEIPAFTVQWYYPLMKPSLADPKRVVGKGGAQQKFSDEQLISLLGSGDSRLKWRMAAELKFGVKKDTINKRITALFERDVIEQRDGKIYLVGKVTG